MSTGSEVGDNLLEFFGYALDVDGVEKTFTFSDSQNPTAGFSLTQPIRCLWIPAESADAFAYSQRLNISFRNHYGVVFRASDTPQTAVLVTDASLDVDGVVYRILTALMEDGLYSLTLMSLNKGAT